MNRGRREGLRWVGAHCAVIRESLMRRCGGESIGAAEPNEWRALRTVLFRAADDQITRISSTLVYKQRHQQNDGLPCSHRRVSLEKFGGCIPQSSCDSRPARCLILHREPGLEKYSPQLPSFALLTLDVLFALFRDRLSSLSSWKSSNTSAGAGRESFLPEQKASSGSM